MPRTLPLPRRVSSLHSSQLHSISSSTSILNTSILNLQSTLQYHLSSSLTRPTIPQPHHPSRRSSSSPHSSVARFVSLKEDRIVRTQEDLQIARRIRSLPELEVACLRLGGGAVGVLAVSEMGGEGKREEGRRVVSSRLVSFRFVLVLVTTHAL
ncbi:hypothetical protein BDY24DRAFT_389094, partial [Mrakia frigida]